MNFVDQIVNFKSELIQEINDKKIILDYISTFKEDVLTRSNEVAHITSSGFIMNKSLDKVLMIHHNIYDTWTWTGGHADGDSDLLKVAIKEAKEETGLNSVKSLSEDIISIDILPVYGHMKKGKYVSAHLHLSIAYVLVANEKDELSINEEENSGVKWIYVDEIHKYSNEPYLIDIYKKIIRKATLI